MMVESTRSALTPLNKDDAASFSEHKQDAGVNVGVVVDPAMSTLTASDPVGSSKSVQEFPVADEALLVSADLRRTKSTLDYSSQSGKGKRPTPPRPNSNHGGHIRTTSDGNCNPAMPNMPVAAVIQPQQQQQPGQYDQLQPPNRMNTDYNPATAISTGVVPQNGPTKILLTCSASKLETIGGTSSTNTPPQPPVQLVPLTRKGSRLDPIEQEQLLFEQRLCQDGYGVAVRKINQNGKSNLRYVKCLLREELDAERNGNNSSNNINNKLTRTESVSSRSVGSWGRNSASVSKHSEQHYDLSRGVLVWGKKKDVQIPVDRFVAVSKGKNTDRTRRNLSPACRLLSLMTNDPNHASLDIEAPTRLDRDKFARAFARFLNVPMQGDADQVQDQTVGILTVSTSTATTPRSTTSAAATVTTESDLQQQQQQMQMQQRQMQQQMQQAAPNTNNAASSTNMPDHGLPPKNSSSPGPGDKQVIGGAWPPPLAPATLTRDSSDLTNKSKIPVDSWPTSHSNPSSTARDTANTNSIAHDSFEEPVVSVIPFHRDPDSPSEDASEMSSLTGHGYDQEIVEELHQALNDIRAELVESRVEAARAVKVAEHAIQSAEKNNSMDWQNTVTHKAAEAAAMAQKRSAEAMAKQRVAEERLEGERRTAAFWRRQAEVAEEEAGALQTRAAAAEVQRSAMDEELQSHLRMTSAKVEVLKSRFSSTEVHQKEALEAALERNRALELELESTRRDLAAKKMHQENLENTNENHRLRKKLSLRPFKKKVSGSDVSDSKMLLAGDAFSSSSPAVESAASPQAEGLSLEQILKLHAETASMRQQFMLLQRATSDQLRSLPGDAKKWVEQISDALGVSQAEAKRLRERLAVESASRRKLLYEVQDLRGNVRVYCRVRPMDRAQSKAARLISLPSQETLMLHREKFGSAQENLGPMSFDFDRVFDPEVRQQDVYSEIEDVCLGVLDGYKICLMAYGQSGSGKTRTLLGDVKHTVISPAGKETKVQIDNHGIQLQALRQLFSVADHRSDRFKDTFSLTIVEVHNERLCDLMAGTATAEVRGRVVAAETKSRRKSQKVGDDDTSSGKQTKLEIRTDLHGDTAVHGVISVDVESFEEACRIWEECLEGRETRLAEQGLDAAEYEASSHVIATIKVVSANIATGQGSAGRIQFVDLAGADLVPRRGIKQVAPSTPDALLSGVGNTNEWKYKNRSLETLSEVVTARSQFVRSVPYRNSTLTHLLRDSLEADTKVLLLACISADPKDIQETASTLRFASRMRRVTIGKATKHTVSPP